MQIVYLYRVFFYHNRFILTIFDTFYFYINKSKTIYYVELINLHVFYSNTKNIVEENNLGTYYKTIKYLIYF